MNQAGTRPPRLGYPRQIRLASRKDVAQVFSRGRYHRLGVLQAKVLATQRAEARFLVSVSKPVGPAPVRNRLKRLVREALRLHRQALRQAHDVCIYIKPPPPSGLTFRHIPFGQIEAEVLQLLGKLNPPLSSKHMGL